MGFVLANRAEKRGRRLFCRRYDISLKEERELALRRLELLCHSGLFSVTDFRCAPQSSARLANSRSGGSGRRSAPSAQFAGLLLRRHLMPRGLAQAKPLEDLCGARGGWLLRRLNGDEDDGPVQPVWR